MIKFEVLCNVQMKYGLNKMKIRLFTHQWDGLMVKELNSIFGSKDQILQLTFIMVNIRILIKYFIPP
jgi:hypothetical protein